MNTQNEQLKEPPYFNRTMYDNCAYERKIVDSTTPMGYYLYEGKFENKGKCVYDANSFYRPFDLVDTESELKGITRPTSKCVQMKYNPNCGEKSATCYTTTQMPIAINPRVCPPVGNNIPRITSKGF
jgi:hypothetical protein